MFNGYPTNAPSPLKSPTYEGTKKFKCPVHSCGSLIVITPLIVSTLYNGLWSDSRSSFFTQLCKYVHHEKHFVATLWSLKPRLFVFIPIIWRIHKKPLTKHVVSNMQSPVTLPSFTVTGRLFVTAFFVSEFSCCVTCSIPPSHPLLRNSHWDWCMTQFLKVFSQNTRTHTYASTHLMCTFARYYIQKGTKSQLSVYDKMHIWCRV